MYQQKTIANIALKQRNVVRRSSVSEAAEIFKLEKLKHGVDEFYEDEG
jgi:hypothetical protein